jgi:RNA polymerase-binding protein DksA
VVFAKVNSKKLPTLAAKADMVAVKSSKKTAKSKERDAERKGVIVPAPVPTDAKPMKNRLGMKTSELEHYRDLLLAKRRELLGDMSSMEHEALNRGGSSNLSNLPMHMADMGTDNYEQEFTLGLMEKDRNLLREINSALAKLQDGSYGVCEGTGLPISKPRLEAQPWAKYSIEHARKLEQRGVR